MEDDYKDLIEEIFGWIKSLDGTEYFRIYTKDAKRLGLIPKLTLQLLKFLPQEYIYFNKHHAEYFIDIRRSKIIEYALENTLEEGQHKLVWGIDNEKSLSIYLSSFLLWIAHGVELIRKGNKNNPEHNYSAVKNEFLGRILSFDSSSDFPNIILSEVISYLNTDESNGELNLFRIELQTIHQTMMSNKPKPTKEVKLLISGKKLNISERYEIANKIFDIKTTLYKLNISAKQKHILLAILLGSAEQTARELFNGTQVKRTRIREELVTNYLKTLK